MEIRLGKHFLATVRLAIVWIISAHFFANEMPYAYRQREFLDALFIYSIIFTPSILITYGTLRFLIRESPIIKETSRSQRVQNWLASLDDDELESLRDRLHDDEHPFDSVVTKAKRTQNGRY